MTDRDFIIGIKNKDQQVFKEFVNTYQVPLMKLCKGFITDKEDVKDVVQDIFIEVFQSINDFRGESKLSTWLYRISVNKSLNFIKRKKKRFLQNKILEKSFDERIKTPSESIETTETLIRIKTAVNSLPKNQRIAFIMNKYMDLSYKEIAEVMDVTLPSVESLLHRAKTNLQKKLYSFYKKNII